MTLDARKRKVQAGYRNCAKCGNCANFSIAGTGTATCSKLAVPVSSNRICNFYRPKTEGATQ